MGKSGCPDTNQARAGEGLQISRKTRNRCILALDDEYQKMVQVLRFCAEGCWLLMVFFVDRRGQRKVAVYVDNSVAFRVQLNAGKLECINSKQ